MTAVEVLGEMIGFFAQTIPIALLAFVPFGDAEITVSRQKRIARIFMIESASSILFGMLEYLIVKHSYEFDMNLYMILYIVIMAVLFVRTVRTPLINKMTVIILLIHYAAVIYLLESIFLIWNTTENMLKYGIPSDIFYLAMGMITGPVIYQFFRRIVSPALAMTGRKSMRRGCMYAGLALLLFCIMVFIYDTYFSKGTWRLVDVFFIFPLIFTDGIIYYMFFAESKLAAENWRLEQQIQSVEEQYRRLNEHIR